MALVKTDVSDELGASFINVTRIGEIGRTLAVNNGVFWDVTPRGSCKNRRFGGTEAQLRRLLVAASVFPISLILVTLMETGDARFLRNVDSYKSHTA
jgi:hypothetical protein